MQSTRKNSYPYLKGRLHLNAKMEQFCNRDRAVAAELISNSSLPYLVFGLNCVGRALRKAPMARWEALRFACQLLSQEGSNKSPAMHRAWRSTIWQYDKDPEFTRWWFYWRVKTAVASKFSGYQFLITRRTLDALAKSHHELDVFNCLRILSRPLRCDQGTPCALWEDTREHRFLVTVGAIYRHEDWYFYV